MAFPIDFDRRPYNTLALPCECVITERVVKSRLIDHLTSSKLLNPHQSAYCKHHSTETVLLYIHDHLINAIGSQKVSCLCILDLSATFPLHVDEVHVWVIRAGPSSNPNTFALEMSCSRTIFGAHASWFELTCFDQQPRYSMLQVMCYSAYILCYF